MTWGRHPFWRTGVCLSFGRLNPGGDAVANSKFTDTQVKQRAVRCTDLALDVLSARQVELSLDGEAYETRKRFLEE